MIKAASPVAVLLTSFAFGIYPPSLRLFGIVLIISLGIGIASYGEVAFSLIGFLIQVSSKNTNHQRTTLFLLCLFFWFCSDDFVFFSGIFGGGLGCGYCCGS